MQPVQIVLLQKEQAVQYANETYLIKAPTLLVGNQPMQLKLGQDTASLFNLQCGDFRSLRPIMLDLLDKPMQQVCANARMRQYPLDLALVSVVSMLDDVNHDAALRFLYAYCLTRDRRYFSDLLWNYATEDESFFEFIDANFRNPWSASEFAEHLDIPLRKLNFLFNDRFGMTVKRWLLERRLQTAREMLLSSTWRVIDVALECGFTSHAHFTETFHYRFGFSPTEMRKVTQQRVPKLDTDTAAEYAQNTAA